MKKRVTAFVVALGLMLALCTGVYAASSSKVAEYFASIGWNSRYEQLNSVPEKDMAALDLTYELGDVVYTLDEVVWENGVLYGTGVMRFKEGVQGVLLPEDYELTDRVGYLEHYGTDEQIPADALSYQQAAQQLGCNLTMPKLVPNGYYEGETLMMGDIGYSYAPRSDGSIAYSFEIFGVNTEPIDESESNEDGEYFGGIRQAGSYKIQLYVGNWQITPEGQWLREEPNNTWLKTEWDVEIVPGAKAE